MPILSPGFNRDRALVASPTVLTEMELGLPIIDKDIGTSSIPGIHTITYWPGVAYWTSGR
jgi:hypothetical protein